MAKKRFILVASVTADAATDEEARSLLLDRIALGGDLSSVTIWDLTDDPSPELIAGMIERYADA